MEHDSLPPHYCCFTLPQQLLLLLHQLVESHLHRHTHILSLCNGFTYHITKTNPQKKAVPGALLVTCLCNIDLKAVFVNKQKHQHKLLRFIPEANWTVEPIVKKYFVDKNRMDGQVEPPPTAFVGTKP